MDLKIFENSFIILVENSLKIKWISKALSEFLYFSQDELIDEYITKITDKNIQTLIDNQKFLSYLKDKKGNIIKGIFYSQKIYDKGRNNIAYLLQFLENEFNQSEEDFLVFNTQNIKMKKLFEKAALVAQSDASVLISGETGTGKSKLARWIHLNSARLSNPFVSVNCSAIPETLFESEFFGYEKGAFTGAITSKPGKVEIADSGTLFLDEIGDLSLTSQAKLLVFVDTKEFERLGSNKTKKVDLRIISATNKNLLKEIQNGSFRSDLYYRIAVIKIEIPPLRERKEDIPLIVNSYLYKKNKRITVRAMEELMKRDWLGNVRELRAVLESACILSGSREMLDIKDFSEDYFSFDEVKKEFDISEELLFNEEKRIYEALKKAKGNRTKAAKLLGISVSTLWRKMKQYNIEINF